MENAILVLNHEKKKLGYVPMKDNVVFARLMDAGKLLKAKVTDIDKMDSWTQISIAIYLTDY
ncbi:HIRAN domain-containing protein [Butyrivibrio sp. AE3006]|uniref:HIRAN domain-containing protein n=1 Tax=Butyrivibrio sp. AE3006 TaxID=1280673 RepID=UPI000403FDA8|nr:HIRAN domain-containing protein [Butyrivibrio sp. AE3006]